MIEVKNLSKSFSGEKVLHNINARFEKGIVNLIIGASGSGKTVLLKSIVGLHEIDEGSVIYNGQTFNKLKFKEQRAIRKKMGMLFQSSALFDSLNVEQNVKFPLDMYTDMDEDDKKKYVTESLRRVDLKNINRIFPAELSGGMKKRVAIARAIVMTPEYLFCDEPTSGLDPKTAIIIDELIQQITKDFNTITVVNTHDMNSVMQIGEKTIFIYQGQKWWEGNTNDLLNSNNKELNDFVFASELSQRARDYSNIMNQHP